ncbi:DUF4249 domain-containing protein [Sphingobacterium sp. LRF_L2]|uniref:DUF4249 domain-containing protein n=1 Tax=Sphingobacterium sp. LRF_L2 TaxID=3369421 RepID=UPI003F60C70B
MKVHHYSFVFLFFLLFVSCEEVIDVDLNEADPRYVIEAQLSDFDNEQRIRVSKTVAFTEAVNSLPVEGATVVVIDGRGRSYRFSYDENGYYVNRNFRPTINDTYTLNVDIDDEHFEAISTMPEYVEVDSIGIMEENIFDETYYFATFKFNDPAEVSNYYRYDISINGGNFRFASALSDKFNDGLYVTHQISDLDTDLVVGDEVLVRRYCVDKPVFDYWNEYQSTNPGTAAPGNPTSNISNNALGYFSVATVQEFMLRVEESVPALEP